jgi:hypothetical protein
MVFFLPETLQKSGPRRSANPIHALKLFLDPPLLILVGTIPPFSLVAMRANLNWTVSCQFLLGGAIGGCVLLILFIFPVHLTYPLPTRACMHFIRD